MQTTSVYLWTCPFLLILHIKCVESITTNRFDICRKPFSVDRNVLQEFQETFSWCNLYCCCSGRECDDKDDQCSTSLWLWISRQFRTTGYHSSHGQMLQVIILPILLFGLLVSELLPFPVWITFPQVVQIDAHTLPPKLLKRFYL